MHILFTVLKIIMLVILVIAGISILILAAVMFNSIKYKSSGYIKDSTEGSVLNGKATFKITALFKIISIKAVFDNESGKADNEPEKIFKYEIRLFGIKINRYKPNSNAAENPDKKTENHESENVLNDEFKDEFTSEETVIEEAENHTGNIISTDDSVTTDIKAADIEKDDNKAESGKQSHSKNFFLKIRQICDKIKQAGSYKTKVQEFFNNEKNRCALKDIKRLCFSIFKYILPSKFNATIKFGAKDPAVTGQILGTLSIFYSIYGNNVNLEPDFENKIFECNYKLKGHVRVITLLIYGLKIYKKKEIKELLKVLSSFNNEQESA